MEEKGEKKQKNGEKQGNQAVKWCFTWPNYPESAIEQLEQSFGEKKWKWIAGMEVCPSTGTPHIQGFCTGPIRARWSEFKLPKEIHWEKAKGNQKQNIIYCSKENETYGPLAIKENVKTLKYEQLFDWQLKIVDMIKGPPDDRKIFWFMGNTNIGKTTFCKFLSLKFGAICLEGTCKDMKNAIVEYCKDNVNTPKILLLNIAKSYNAESFSYEGIEKLKDMYFYSGKYEGGMVCGNPPHLMVFSNYMEIDYEALAEDRWVIHDLSEKPKWDDLYEEYLENSEPPVLTSKSPPKSEICPPQGEVDG